MVKELLEKYGIYFLIIVYLVINIFYKNKINIIIFIMALLSTINLLENKQNAFIIAYILSILYGIISNFHLLENFKANTTIKIDTDSDNDNDNDNDNIQIDSVENKRGELKDQLDNQKNEVLQQRANPKIDKINSLISTKLIDKFINKLKKHDNSLISYKSINVNDIHNTISELDSKKIKSFIDSFSKDKIVGNTPIVLSNDNFIVDGHHRWYAYKLYIEDEKTADETMNVIVIDLPLNKLINRMQEYKIEYNENIYDKFKLDSKSMNKASKCIKTIKDNINELDNHYKSLQHIKLV